MADPEGDTLERRLIRRIHDSGPLTFAAFMEAALYDPDDGFFSRHDVGRRGEFVTSPHVSPVFGRLLARQVEEFRHALDDPDPFTVVEIGAGDGTLAAQILDALDPTVRSTMRYVAVERTPRARSMLATVPGVEAVAGVRDVVGVDAGCVLANEVLDNVPFHRVRWTADGVRELFVDHDGLRFVLVEDEPTTVAIAALAAVQPPPAGEAIVPLGATSLLEDAARLLHRGFIWLDDYGSASPQEAARHPVHGYRAHRLEDDVLEAPGSRDITAGVDFSLVIERARSLGLRTWGPVTQRSMLLALGFRDLDTEGRERQVRALDARHGIDAMRIYSERNLANHLLAPPGLGDFLVLYLGTGVDEPTPAIASALDIDATADRS